MSNITSLQIGQNKIEISNKWVYTQSSYNLSYNESFSTGKHELDLSNYLPDDDYVYEIQGWITFSSSTNTLLQLGNSKSTRRYFTEPVSQNWDTCVFNLEILKDKKMILYIDEGQSTNTYIEIKAYRKLYIDDYT